MIIHISNDLFQITSNEVQFLPSHKQNEFKPKLIRTKTKSIVWLLFLSFITNINPTHTHNTLTSRDLNTERPQQ